MGRVERFRTFKSKSAVERRAPWAKVIKKVGSVFVAYADPLDAADEHAPVCRRFPGSTERPVTRTDLKPWAEKPPRKSRPPKKLSSRNADFLAEAYADGETIENKYTVIGESE